MRVMGDRDRMSKVLPRWGVGLLAALPALGAAITEILFSLTGHQQLFNLSPKDTFLVVGIGSGLVFIILDLAILCAALTSALRRLP